MTIGYVSCEDPFTNRRAWSGTKYKVREAIENAGFEVVWIRIIPPRYLMPIIRILLKIRYGFTQNHPWINKILAKYTDWDNANKCDLLFFSGGAQIMKYSPINKDYIYYTDAYFCQMVDYYWHNIDNQFVRLANDDEHWAIKHAALNLCASDWARNCAIQVYKCNSHKNFVLEFGANLDTTDICKSEVYLYGQLNILFSGVNWERKGGDVAVEVVRLLNEKYNIKARLFIAGIKELPQNIDKLDYIVNLGFLNKNIQDEYNKYVDLVKKCHILLLPTKAECAGIVFCEASAYGLPIYTHDTGGIGNYVINGVNGYRLKLNSSANDFADKIYNSISNGELTCLHEGALKLYSERLNWKIWSKRFKEIINTHYQFESD